MISFQSKAFVFFGSAEDSFEKIQSDFPDLNFKKIRQTHSDIVMKSSDQPVEADSHYTSNPKEALIIATADCLPIMIYCKQTHRVAAVHAGWRGVENKITEKTLQKLIMTGSSEKDFQFWIGPHILQNSFEIDFATYLLLSKSHYNLKDEDYMIFKNGKYYVALNKIVESQIKNVLNNVPEIISLNIDTKTNLDYYSYRRDQKTKARNISFIYLLD